MLHVSSSLIFDLSLLLLPAPLMFIQELFQHTLHVGGNCYVHSMHSLHSKRNKFMGQGNSESFYCILKGKETPWDV